LLILNSAFKAEDDYIEILEQNQTLVDHDDFTVEFPSANLLILRSKALLRYMIHLALNYATGYSFYSKGGYPLFIASQLHLSYSLDICQATVSKGLGLLTYLGFINKLKAAEIPWDLIRSERFTKRFGHVGRNHLFYTIPVYNDELLKLAETRASACTAFGLRPSIWGSHVVRNAFGALEALRTYPKQKSLHKFLVNDQLSWEAEKFALTLIDLKGFTTKDEVIRYLHSQNGVNVDYCFTKLISELEEKYNLTIGHDNEIKFRLEDSKAS
jgi:hypothetical protein